MLEYINLFLVKADGHPTIITIIGCCVSIITSVAITVGIPIISNILDFLDEIRTNIRIKVHKVVSDKTEQDTRIEQLEKTLCEWHTVWEYYNVNIQNRRQQYVVLTRWCVNICTNCIVIPYIQFKISYNRFKLSLVKVILNFKLHCITHPHLYYRYYSPIYKCILFWIAKLKHYIRGFRKK